MPNHHESRVLSRLGARILTPEEVSKETGLGIDSVYKAKARVTQTLRKKLRSLTEEHGWGMDDGKS